MRRAILATTALAALLATGTATAYAADHQVQMLNKGEKGIMVFQPAFVEAAVGDTVTFVPTDKGHDAASIDGMLPDGAQPFKGEMSKPITITIGVEGVYGVKCVPHYGMGMVALIVAGKPTNLDKAKTVKQPGKAKAAFADLFAQVPAGN